MQTKSKLSETDKANIKRLYDDGAVYRELAEAYQVSVSYIGGICSCYENRTSDVRVNRQERVLESAITSAMVRELKARLHTGDKVICLDTIELDEGTKRKKKIGCEVVTKSQYVFVIKRPGGYMESYSYVDLAMGSCVRMG